MRRKSSFFWMLSIFLVFAIAMTNCTKEGPAGPAGADGVDGTNGTDGTDGVDGNSTCLECHTQANMDAIAASFNEHKHVIGSSWARGTSASCGRCHSHDGFVEYVRSGNEIAATISTQLECKSCHNSHSSLEEGISAPIYEFASVASMVHEGSSYDYGKGNLCAFCHQARRGPSSYYSDEAATYDRKFTGDDIAVYQAHGAIGPNGSMELIGDTLFVTFDVPTTHTYTNSTHAGPHHGPQANVMAADIGSIMGEPFDRDHHTDCASCHVNAETDGSGHTFVPNIASCNECHESTGYDMEAEMQEIADRMEAVKMALEEIGAIHIGDDGIHPMYASLPTNQWNAFWDYMCLLEDNSHGVHNFAYAKTLLSQAETALGL